MKKRKRAKHKACFNCLKCDVWEIGKYIEMLHKQIAALENKLEKAERELAAEVKHGEWIIFPNTIGTNPPRTYYRGVCSVCGITVAKTTQEEIKILPYCHCGARMDCARCENDK